MCDFIFVTYLHAVGYPILAHIYNPFGYCIWDSACLIHDRRKERQQKGEKGGRD